MGAEHLVSQPCGGGGRPDTLVCGNSAVEIIDLIGELAEPIEDSGREGLSDRMKEIRACRAKMRVPEMLDMIAVPDQLQAGGNEKTKGIALRAVALLPAIECLSLRLAQARNEGCDITREGVGGGAVVIADSGSGDVVKAFIGLGERRQRALGIRFERAEIVRGIGGEIGPDARDTKALEQIRVIGVALFLVGLGLTADDNGGVGEYGALLTRNFVEFAFDAEILK